MKYRPLGNTGLKVSEVSFGTIPILSGDVGVLPDYFSPNMETAIGILEHAYSLGCNLYDTAVVEEYGDAETKLGRFAKTVGRENIIIADKARFFDGDGIYNAVLQSSENLDSYIDIYFVHQVDPSNEEVAFQKYGAVDALCELKAEGRIRFVGIASHYYDILLRGAKDERVDVLQGSGNLLERGMLDRIANEPLFRNKGMIVNKVLAAGLLARSFEVSQLIAGVLTYPISTALIGLGTKGQVEQAMRPDYTHCTCPSFSQVQSKLERRFTPISCDRCQRCRCPHGTEIHTLFRQYNYYFLGKEYWALRKLDLGIEVSAARCKECLEMPCRAACPRGTNIPEKIALIRRLVATHIRNGII